MSVLTDLPVAPDPPHVTSGGYVSRYTSPFGRVAGIACRMADWAERMGTDRSLPWVGLGICEDLKMAARILSLREFGENLRVHGTPEQREWSDELLRNEETLEATTAALSSAGLTNFDPPAAVETLTRERDADRATVRAVRQMLVDQGMLAEGDETTPVVDLLRALLA